MAGNGAGIQTDVWEGDAGVTAGAEVQNHA
jgi:hypothetical protein